ncbi:MHYT domain-containing protein [Streptomyces sp. 3214.6]|uniref:MHYT domain-containing protein n=1 Tax=Streptomyces sp. 3214.6 TaxID=1882757 RepID=UPI00090CD006|nr:MHYT domain-containing protein [Streptomyces sp. 3214.6]SHI22501.1 MHYT domain-containing protein, NO-binding membrane sensor [Streptomyces sp. 3214.6]
MTATVSNFYYGAATPVAAYLMACLGAALGLRCTTRSLRHPQRRARWLALGAISIGCGIWTMHFIAMIGFNVQGALVRYDTVRTLLSLVVAIAVVAVGVFLVGYRGGTPANLAVAGTVTGLGVAAMHYLGMAAIHTNGTLRYDATTVAVSIVIAVAAATAALWAAVSIHALWSSLCASLVMGVAVTGMHYTGMAAVSVQLTGQAGVSESSTSLLSFLLVMLAGPLVVLLVAAVIVMFDPDMILGDDEQGRSAVQPQTPSTAFYAQHPAQPSQPPSW